MGFAKDFIDTKNLQKIVKHWQAHVDKPEEFPGMLPCVPVPELARVKVLEYKPDEYQYFVVSDVHGDYVGFRAIVDKVCGEATACGKTPALILLGDLIDRGKRSVDCIAYLFKLLLGADTKCAGVKVFFVKGDHDSSISCNLETKVVHATVTPSEFATELCEKIQGTKGSRPERLQVELELAHLFEHFVDSCPSAACLPTGVFFSHGGLPRFDACSALDSLARLNENHYVCAFEMARIATRRISDDGREIKPDVFLNPATSAPGIGARQIREFFGAFNGVMSPWLKMPVSVFVHGHEHPVTGFDLLRLDSLKIYTVASCPDKDPLRPVTTPCVLLLDEIDGHMEAKSLPLA